MHSSDVCDVQFVPVGMDDTVEDVHQRVAELPSFAGRVVTLHAEGVLLETGPFSETGIEDGGAVQVQTTHVDEDTTLEEQFLKARKKLRKKQPDTTHVVQQLSVVERRWVASERTQTKMVHFVDPHKTIERGFRWEHLSKKDKKLGAALQEAGFDVCCVQITCSVEKHEYCRGYGGFREWRGYRGYCDDSEEEEEEESSSGSEERDYDVTASCWPAEAGLPQNVRTLLLLDYVTEEDFVVPDTAYDLEDGDIETAFVFWPRRWRAKHISRDQLFPLLWEACMGVLSPTDLGCSDIVALQEVCVASVETWTPTLRATMLECVSQPSMPGIAAATFLTDHFTLSTISEAEVASLERLLQRDTPAINTAFLNVFQVYSGMEKAGCAVDVLLLLAKKGVNTALLKRCADCVATSRAVCSKGSKTQPPKTKTVTHFTIAILRLLLHLDMKAEMEKVLKQIRKNKKKYRAVPVVSEAALALMDDAATVEASASLAKIAQSRLKRKDVLVASEEHMDASEVAVLMRFIACCVDAEEGKALLKKVASRRFTDSIPRCAAVLNGALTVLKGVPALGVASVCFPAGMCQEWVWSCLENVIGEYSKSVRNFGAMYSKQSLSVTMFIVPATLLQHLGGGAAAVQQLLDTTLFTSLMKDRSSIQALADAMTTHDDGAVLDMIYSRCIDRLHKTCPVLPEKPKNWHLEDTLSAPCCHDCQEVCRFLASDFCKYTTMHGRNVTRKGHVAERVLALPGQGRTFEAEVLSSARVKVNGVLQIRKVPCGQVTDQELQQYDKDAQEHRCVHTLIKQLEARKRALPKEETPPSTEHDPDAEEAVQDSPGEPPLKRRRVEHQNTTNEQRPK